MNIREMTTRAESAWLTFKEGNVACFAERSWRVAWPMTLIMFFDFLIGLTDVFVAGRIGRDIQAAYGFVIQLYMVSIIIANALTVGTVSVVSRLFTSGKQEELNNAVFTSLAAAGATGAIVAVLGYLLQSRPDPSPQHPPPAQALLHTPHPDILGGPPLRVPAHHLQRRA